MLGSSSALRLIPTASEHCCLLYAALLKLSGKMSCPQAWARLCGWPGALFCSSKLWLTRREAQP